MLVSGWKALIDMCSFVYLDIQDDHGDLRPGDVELEPIERLVFPGLNPDQLFQAERSLKQPQGMKTASSSQRTQAAG